MHFYGMHICACGCLWYLMLTESGCFFPETQILLHSLWSFVSSHTASPGSSRAIEPLPISFIAEEELMCGLLGCITTLPLVASGIFTMRFLL